MKAYAKGRRLEYRVMRILEAAGYVCSRAASSKGVFDVIAWNTKGFRCISVKSGTARASLQEKESMLLTPLPANATREVWRLPDRCREPIIEVLG